MNDNVWPFLTALVTIVMVILQARSARMTNENKAQLIKVETESKSRLLELESKSKDQDANNEQMGKLIDALMAATAAQNDANKIANDERIKWRTTVETNAEAKLALASAVEVNTSTLATVQKDMADRFLNVGSIVMQAKQEAVGALEMKMDDNTAEVMERMDAIKGSVDNALRRIEEGVATQAEVKRVLERMALLLDGLPKLATRELPAVVAPPTDHDAANAALVTRLESAVEKRQTGEVEKTEPPPAKDDPAA